VSGKERAGGKRKVGEEGGKVALFTLLARDKFFISSIAYFLTDVTDV